MKKIAILFALTLCVALAGCNQPAPPQGGEPVQEPSGTVSTPPVEEPAEPTAPAVGQVAMVYIGTKAGGFTLEGGDPDALDVWYFMEGDQPLELPDLGLSWPIDQPYQWEGAKSE